MPTTKPAVHAMHVIKLSEEVLEELKSDDADAELLLFMFDQIQSSVGKMRSHVEKHYTGDTEVAS